MVIPAEGPSLGVAPAGTWRWTKLSSKKFSYPVNLIEYWEVDHPSFLSAIISFVRSIFYSESTFANEEKFKTTFLVSM